MWHVAPRDKIIFKMSNNSDFMAHDGLVVNCLEFQLDELEQNTPADLAWVAGSVHGSYECVKRDASKPAHFAEPYMARSQQDFAFGGIRVSTFRSDSSQGPSRIYTLRVSSVRCFSASCVELFSASMLPGVLLSLQLSNKVLITSLPNSAKFKRNQTRSIKRTPRINR